ncbi:hypothetical protein F4808DRAFT_272345 [Astrocystis sublimbata]|nr:hypothetical protein F4808DRAFT_272345 [Astrocystis sublimbata]
MKLSIPRFSQAGFRSLVLLVAIITLYVTYGHFCFYRDPLSIFFSEKHGYRRFYSATRQAEADSFLDGLEADPDAVHAKLGKAGPEPEMCAIFTTVGREMQGRQYIETAVGSFLANLSRVERERIHLKIFFADEPEPEKHPSYPRLVAADVADEIMTYRSTLLAFERESKLDLLKAWHRDRRYKSVVERKTLYDYAYALHRCADNTTAPYIALFEDDILLADGWAVRTLNNLLTLDKTMMIRKRQHRQNPGPVEPGPGHIGPGVPLDWLYMRLFNQERSSGWAGGYGFRSNNAHVISLLVGLPLLAVISLARRFCLPRHIGRHIDGWVAFVVCGIAVPLFVWLFFASGKASLLPTSPGIHEEWFGCCSQALVFNRRYAQQLSNFLINDALKFGKPGRGDMLPKQFAWDQGLARVSAYPMMAQHLGRISATHTTSEEANKIWSMAFENLKAHKLAREHYRDIAELFGPDEADEMIKQ